jgi:hypothetical protein
MSFDKKRIERLRAVLKNFIGGDDLWLEKVARDALDADDSAVEAHTAKWRENHVSFTATSLVHPSKEGMHLGARETCTICNMWDQIEKNAV